MLSINTFKNIATSMGGKCLSGVYTHCFTKLSFECKEKHLWMAKPSHIKAGSWCPECAKLKTYVGRTSRNDKAKLLLNLINKMKKVDFELLDDFYISNRHLYNVKCNRDHLIKIRGCDRPVCSPCKKENSIISKLNACYAVAEQNKGRCLSTEYTGIQTKMNWECENKHQWSAVFNHIKAGSWCPYCKNKNEQQCRSIFETLLNSSFPLAYPKFLQYKKSHQLQLDGYCEDLGLAFEYDGEQHYVANTFHKNALSVEERQEKDRLKDKLCKENNVVLIRIPYFIADKNSFIINKLKEVYY